MALSRFPFFPIHRAVVQRELAAVSDAAAFRGSQIKKAKTSVNCLLIHLDSTLFAQLPCHQREARRPLHRTVSTASALRDHRIRSMPEAAFVKRLMLVQKRLVGAFDLLGRPMPDLPFPLGFVEEVHGGFQCFQNRPVACQQIIFRKRDPLKPEMP